MPSFNRRSTLRNTDDDMHVPLLANSRALPKDEHLKHSKMPLQRHAYRIETRKRPNRFNTIYFTPESLRGSKIMFGPPAVSPQSSPATPGIQEILRYRPELEHKKYDASISQQSLPCPSQEEMDYLVDQLARSDVFPRPPKDKYADDSSSFYSESDRCDSPTLPSTSSFYLPTSISTAPPSLSSGTSKSSTASLPGASLANYTGTIDHIKRRSREISLETRGVEPRQNQGKERVPSLPLPPLFESIALTDPKVYGQPIRYTSPSFELGTNVLKVGSCTFLNLPYSANVECGLRTESKPSLLGNRKQAGNATGVDYTNQQVRLQIVQRAVHARTGHPAMLLCAETDVSEGFTSTVRTELAARFEKPLSMYNTLPSSKIFPANAFSNLEGDTLTVPDAAEFLSPAMYQGRTTKANRRRSRLSTVAGEQDPTEDIWLNLARSLSMASSSKTPLPDHSQPLARPSPALRDLFSLLDEIKLLHRNFFVIRMTTTSTTLPGSEDVRGYQEMLHPSGRLAQEVKHPAKFSIPWLSAQLYQTLLERQGKVNMLREKDRGSSVLKAFCDAMALQLSPEIFPLAIERDGSKPKAGAFVKQIKLPRMVLNSDRDSACHMPSSVEASNLIPEMGVYAVPMFDDALGRGQTKEKKEVKCWTCFLVEKELEGLWA